MLSWIFSNWTLFTAGALVLIGWGALRYLVGWKLSLPAGLAGAGMIIFLMGKKIERDNHKKYVQDIHEKRKRAYEEIDSRGTDEFDVLDRLRKHGF